MSERLPVIMVWRGKRTLIRGLPHGVIYWLVRAYARGGKREVMGVFYEGAEPTRLLSIAIAREARDRVQRGLLWGNKIAHWINVLDPSPCHMCGAAGLYLSGSVTACSAHRDTITALNIAQGARIHDGGAEAEQDMRAYDRVSMSRYRFHLSSRRRR